MLNNLFSKRSVLKTHQKFLYLGIDNSHPEVFLMIKWIILFSIFLVLCFLNIYTFIFSVPIILLINFLYEYVAFIKPINKRKNMLEHDAILYLKALSIANDANKNLKTALYVTSKNLDSSFSNAVTNALNEVKYGKGLYDALKDLENVLPSKNLQYIISGLNENAQIGSDCHSLILKQIDYLESFEEIKKYQKLRYLPLKIALNALLFIIPIVFMLAIIL